MNFTIYFKDITLLNVNGSSKTFNKDSKYGFINIDKKEYNKIRKQCLKSDSMIFTETSNFEGCIDIIRKITTSKDVTVDNLITMNKGKKNKNKNNLVSKSLKSNKDKEKDEIAEDKEVIEDEMENKEMGENGLTSDQEPNIIDIGDEVNE